MSNTPSDAEIREVWENYNPLHGIESFARAVLAKWGTPAVAGEPVAWRYRPSAVWDDYVLTDDPEKAARARGNGLHVEALCLATPQPTQAVPPVAREPLTNEQRMEVFNEAMKRCDENLNLPWRVAVLEQVEIAHGITQKGGQ